MQSFTEALGWFLVIGGIILIFLAVVMSINRTDDESIQSRTESKGIIFLGPIPIVWGYGKMSMMISIIAIVAILFFIVIVVLP
jgi:uncharacterized protein (TIGR00304 family)